MKLSIRTLFWDLGGVALTNGWDEISAPAWTRLGSTSQPTKRFIDRANYYWERGLITAGLLLADRAEAQSRLGLTFELLWPQVMRRIEGTASGGAGSDRRS